MKKHARLLCAILVLAMLCSALFFVAGAEETEPFKKSFEAVKYSGNKINDGQLVTSMDAVGNRVTSVTTMNEANSPFLSIAKGNTDDPYVIAYANRDTNEKNASNNNLAISVNTATSAPFTVIGEGAKGYYVIDFDVATHGNMLPGFDVSVVMRRESDTGGYPFSDEIFVGNYVTEPNAWTHLTLVGDIANNVVKIYVNGTFVGDSGVAVRNSTNYDSNQLRNDTKVKALGYRIELTRNNVQATYTNGDNAVFDNFAHRLLVDSYDDLASAIESGNLTGWSGYTNGRGGELMPVVATVDGVEYRNFAELDRAFATNDTVSVDFLAQPFAPISFCANAQINTNGMSVANLIACTPECEIKSVDGDIVTTTAPFVSNLSESYILPSDALKVMKSSHPDNLLSQFTANNYGVVNGRGMYQVIDRYTGVSYINERVFGGTVDNNSNVYNGWFPSGNRINYTRGTNQHIVIDFDAAMYDGNTYTLKTITRTSSGGSAWNDGNDITLNSLYEGYEYGEFVHITMVLSVDTKAATVFVNGKYTLTRANNLSDNTDHYFQCLRTGGNSSANVNLANVCIRSVKDSELTSAVTGKDIATWSGAIYGIDYKMPTPPAILAIDGVAYSSKVDAEAALYGNKETPAVVKVLHAFDEVITVNCDANVYTYGQDVTFVDAKGKTLVPNKDGVIRLDVPYMAVRLEQQLTVGDGSSSAAILNAISAPVKGNRLNAFVPSAGNWGAEGYRNASLVTNIESGDVLYRDSANLGADGKLNSDSNEYTEIKFTSVSLTKEAGNHEYIVLDFDFGTDGHLADDVAIKLGDTKNGVLLSKLGILDGDMAHVTVVFNLQTNSADVFVNGVFANSFADAVLNPNVFNTYNGGATATVDKLVLSTEQKISTVCLDNVAVRSFDYVASTEDTLAGTVAAGNLTDWADNIYNSDYKISKLPTLAVVDGRVYGSVYTLNNLLAIHTDYVKAVEMKYSPLSEVKILTEASVETHGLDVNMNWNTGLYAFNPGNTRYENRDANGNRTGYAYASTKFVCTTVGSTYNFTEINADNCWSNATVAIWAYEYFIDFDVYDVVFYPHGEQMNPIDSGEFVKDGVKYVSQWIDVVSGDYAIVEAFPVAGPNETMKIYGYEPITTNASSYAAKDMMYSANISTNIVFTFYVAAAETVSEGRNVVINGKDYVAFDFELAPHEIDKVITVSFNVKNQYGAIYEQRQDICFVDYARKLLESNRADVDKTLIVALLNYANEASALFNGGVSAMSSVQSLVDSYSDLIVNAELTEKLDTADLSAVVRSAALRLNATPDFVFKIGRGFRGTVTLSYEGLNGKVEQSVYLNTLASEKTVSLTGIDVYDVSATITITLLADGSDTPVVGQYNLATYAQSLEDNAFAVALYNYSQLAKEYKENGLESDYAASING